METSINNKCKAFTSLEQSKNLAKILPLESADMYYKAGNETQPTFRLHSYGHIMFDKGVCAWSLAALLDVASTYCNRLEITLRADKNYNIFAVSGDFVFRSFDECSEGYNNLVDACYNLVIKLNELKML